MCIQALIRRITPPLEDNTEVQFDGFISLPLVAKSSVAGCSSKWETRVIWSSCRLRWWLVSSGFGNRSILFVNTLVGFSTVSPFLLIYARISVFQKCVLLFYEIKSSNIFCMFCFQAFFSLLLIQSLGACRERGCAGSHEKFNKHSKYICPFLSLSWGAKRLEIKVDIWVAVRGSP